MHRSDLLAVLLAILALGAGAYLSTFPADTLRSVGSLFMGLAIIGLIIWFAKGNEGRTVHFWGPWLLILGGPIVGALWLYTTSNQGSSASPPAPTITQPDFSLLSPTERYDITLDRTKPSRIVIRKESENNPAILVNNIGFVLKNKTNTVAYEVKLTWKTEITGVDELIKNSNKLTSYKIDISGSRITFISSPDDVVANFGFDVTQKAEHKLAVIANEADAYVPLQFYAPIAFYLIDKMPEQIGGKSDPFIMTLSVNWGIPPGGAIQNFRIKVFAVNSKPAGVTTPELAGYLTYEIEKLP